MEIEAKYRVLRPVDALAIAELDLSPYRLADGAEHELHDTILDTADRAITGAGCGLRMRRDGQRTLLTFKGVGTVEGAVHRRAEHEAELPAPTLERAAWPAEIETWVRQLAGDRPVGALLEVRNLRHTWRVLRDDRPQAELAFDEGALIAGGAEEPFRELEVELTAAADESMLADMEERLRAALPLEPEPRSKLARALALLERTRAASAAAKEGAADVEADDDEEGVEVEVPARPLAQVARKIVGQNLEKLREAEAVARLGEDLEGVHDMRVASRRIRAALRVLVDAGVEAQQAQRLQRRLRQLAQALGEQRDLDVFLERARADETTPAALILELERRWAASRKALARTLDAKKTRRLLGAVAGWLAEQPQTLPRRPGDPTLIRHVARSAIWRSYEEALAYEVLMPAPPETLHQLRIAVKRLRYTLEFFADALGSGSKALRKDLTTIQDHLGDLQDQAAALTVLDELIAQRGDTTELETYRGRRLARQAELTESFKPLWESLGGPGFAQRLSRALASV